MEGHYKRFNRLLNSNNFRWVLFVLFAPAVFVLYGETLSQTMRSFNDPLESMSHGWLIPIVSAHAIWRQRPKLKVALKKYSWTGFLLVFLSLALFRFGCVLSLLCLKQLSLIGLIWSLTFSLWGWKAAKLLIFPIWYLVFAISTPSILETLVVQLQGISTSAVFYAMNGLGFEIHQIGNALSSGIEGSEFYFAVAGSCSGIRSLLALTALTSIYAWHSQSTLARKWFLFACSIPIAIICNIIRVFSMCFIAVLFGQKAALGYYHDYSGYVIALISIVSIFRLGQIVATFQKTVGSKTGSVQ